ncbi:MAG: helix-turn-helix domain-containing protein [Acidimicrobiia bacterium]|nr:helix-turn-helix domain-containing protein [Acidimicrobiia bacterium]
MVDAVTASRADRHAALGDPVRLAIVDELVVSDRMPSELQALVELPSNLLAHHLDVLEHAGLITRTRTRSSGDGRRRYVHLHRQALADLTPGARLGAGPALFVCTQSSARSQVAAALWHELTGTPATAAGTHPAERVHPEAMKAAQRAGLDLTGAVPRHLDDVKERPALVVTVCDRAHEEGVAQPGWLHWSVPDPVQVGTPEAFDAAVVELRERITSLVAAKAA